MAASPARRDPRATYDDLVSLPARVVGEILSDELHATSRPRVRHSRLRRDTGSF